MSAGGKIKSLLTADDGKTKAEILERITACRVLWEKKFDIESVALSLWLPKIFKFRYVRCNTRPAVCTPYPVVTAATRKTGKNRRSRTEISKTSVSSIPPNQQCLNHRWPLLQPDYHPLVPSWLSSFSFWASWICLWLFYLPHWCAVCLALPILRPRKHHAPCPWPPALTNRRQGHGWNEDRWGQHKASPHLPQQTWSWGKSPTAYHSRPRCGFGWHHAHTSPAFSCLSAATILTWLPQKQHRVVCLLQCTAPHQPARLASHTSCQASPGGQKRCCLAGSSCCTLCMRAANKNGPNSRTKRNIFILISEDKLGVVRNNFR